MICRPGTRAAKGSSDSEMPGCSAPGVFSMKWKNDTRTEDADYVDMMNYYLVEHGADRAAGLSDEAFHERIQRRYLEVLDGVYETAAPDTENLCPRHSVRMWEGFCLR